MTWSRGRGGGERSTLPGIRGGGGEGIGGGGGGGGVLSRMKHSQEDLPANPVYLHCRFLTEHELKLFGG